MLLVDAYNVLHTTGILPPHLAGPDVADLADLIAASRYARHRTILVCDGKRKPAHKHGRVEIVYAGPGKDADSAIETLMQTEGRAGGREMTVISADRRLRQAARRRKARCLSSATFLRQLADDHQLRTKVGPRRRPSDRPAFATDLPLDSAAAQAWIDHQGISPDDPILRIPAGYPLAPRGASPGDSPPTPPRRPPVPKPARTDPTLLEALKEWSGRISLDDLDMSRWLKE